MKITSLWVITNTSETLAYITQVQFYGFSGDEDHKLAEKMKLNNLQDFDYIVL